MHMKKQLISIFETLLISEIYMPLENKKCKFSKSLSDNNLLASI
jgi:hypothetical protein